MQSHPWRPSSAATSLASSLLLAAVAAAIVAHAQPQLPYDPYGTQSGGGQSGGLGVGGGGGGYQPVPSVASPLSNNDLTGLQASGGANPFGGYNPYGGGGGGQSSLNSLTADLLDERNFCPEFWIAHQKTCYRFHKSPKRNWHEARRLCKAMNADLLVADTIDKHAFVLRELIVQDQRQNR